MNKKTFTFLVLIFAFALCFADSNESVCFDGSFEYEKYSNGMMILKGGTINNNYSHSTGKLECSIILSEKAYTGKERLRGYPIFTLNIKPLKRGEIYKVNATLPYKNPPNGSYYIVLVLLEDGKIVDHLEFKNQMVINIPQNQVPLYGQNINPTYNPYTDSYNPYKSQYNPYLLAPYLVPDTPPQTQSQTSPKKPLYKDTQCNFCHGTKKSPLKEYAPRYSGADSYVKCSVCGEYDYSHWHKSCPSCGGTGKVKERNY